MVFLLIRLSDGGAVEAAMIGGIISSGHKPASGRVVVQIPGAVFSISAERPEVAKQQSHNLGEIFARLFSGLDQPARWQP